ncbi:T9SS type A sorting domain-containing protein [bacterium]|nr:T9SS type A sorting domain-containing protein [bacterium]
MRSAIISLLFLIPSFLSAFTLNEWEKNHISWNAGKTGGIDEQWDIQFILYDTMGEIPCFALAFYGDYLWTTSANQGNKYIHIWDRNGNLITSFDQHATSYWGIRDFCTDEDYVYGGWENGLDYYDPQTYTYVGTIPHPVNMIFPRGVAYDPEGDKGNGSFYCGNWSNPMYEMDRSGNLIRILGPPGVMVHGLAWDDDDPNGPWLWIHADQNGNPYMLQMDPISGTYTGVSFCTGSLTHNATAQGCDYTDEYDPLFSTMLVSVHGLPAYIAGFEMYPLGPPPQVAVNLTPLSPPIQIPASGGTFDYNIELTNIDTSAISFDAWIKVVLPGGSYLEPLIGLVDVSIALGGSITRTKTQIVPANAPPGDYTYIVNAGYYPEVCAGDSFNFEKLLSDDGFISSGGFSDESIVGDNPGIITVSPNPFNAKTVISYQLTADSYVELMVYDVQGREVQSLVTGHLSLGQNEVIWDAEDFASGIYFVRFQAGDLVESRKLLLIK